MPTCHICGHHHECVLAEHKEEKREQLPPPPYNPHVDAVAAELNAAKSPGSRVVSLFSPKANSCFQEQFKDVTDEQAVSIASKMMVGGEPVVVLSVYKPATFRAKKPDNV